MLSKTQIAFLRSLRQKSVRTEQQLFLAEGPKAVNEFLAAPGIRLHSLYLTEFDELHLDGIPESQVYTISGNDLKRVSNLTTPNICVGVFHQPRNPAPGFSSKLTLMLDEIQDPGNLGTIIRCADWFGIVTILCSPGCADVYNPKVVQATMGSLARIQIHQEIDLASILKQQSHLPAYAATLHGTPVGEIGRIREGFLVIGNESHGISAPLLNIVPHQVTIPRNGQAESLNAGVATGILLSHLTA